MPADLVADQVLTPLTLADPQDGDLRPIRIIPDGVTTSTNGTIRLDAKAAQVLVAAFNADPGDLLVDYEHQSEGGTHAAPDGKAPAAGWVKKLWYEAGRGLMGLVQWTARARDMIRAGEYRHLSPALLVHKVDGLVAVLKSVAVTNTPAIKGLEPLTASVTPDSQAPPTAGRRPPSTPRGDTGGRYPKLTEKEGQLMDALRKLLIKLGVELAEDAGVEAIAQAAIAELTALAELKKEGDAEADTEASTNTTRDAVSPELRQVLMDRDAAVQALKDRDVDARLEPWFAKAYINPNDARDVAFCRQLAGADPEMFELQMSLRKEYVPQGRTTPPPAGTASTASRRGVIMRALREVAENPDLEKLSRREDLVNLALREADLPMLEDGELKAYL